MTFNTGKKPGEHGVYFQLQWDPVQMRLRSLDQDWVGDLTPFWRKGVLGTARGIVLDPSFTFAGAESTHLEVMGWSAHSSLETYQCNDRDEERRIRAKFGINPIGNESQIERGHRARVAERDRMIRSARARGQLIRDLMEHHPWDFVYAVFGETHRAGHVLWPADVHVPPNAMLDVFKAVDDALGHIFESLTEDVELIVFAAQGMGHQSSQSHFCRPLLEKALEVMGHTSADVSAHPGAVAWLRKTIPARVQWELRHRMPLRLRDHIVAREYAGGIVPGKTIAFPLRSDNNGYWRLLVSGREAHGTLSQPEAQRFREDFAEIIQGFRISGGEPLIRDVLFPSENAESRAHFLPDVVAAWNTDIHPVAEAHHPKLGTIRGTLDKGRTGNHRFQGFYVHAGRKREGAAIPNHVADLPNFIETLPN